MNGSQIANNSNSNSTNDSRTFLTFYHFRFSYLRANEALSFWKVVIPELPYSPLVRFTSALVELTAVAPQRATKESTNAFENLQDR